MTAGVASLAACSTLGVPVYRASHFSRRVAANWGAEGTVVPFGSGRGISLLIAGISHSRDARAGAGDQVDLPSISHCDSACYAVTAILDMKAG